MLFILNEKNKYHRILRRGIVIGVLVIISMMLEVYMPSAPGLIVPILTAVLAMLDKLTRELKEE